MGQRDYLPVQGWLRGLIMTTLVLGILLLLTTLQHVIEILFILFAGILLGVFLDGLVKFVTKYTPVPHAWAVTLVLIGFGGLLVATGWLIAQPFANDMTRLYEHLSQGISQIHSKIKETAWLQPWLPNAETLLANPGNVIKGFTNFLSTSLGVMVNGVIILFVGIYLAVHPAFYIENGVRILPPAKRERTQEVLAALGRGLRRWVYGRLVTMAVVGILTATGLLIAGLSLAIPLGVIAGLLAFVPYIGPVLSVIPAILVSLAEGPAMVGSVLIVYLIVQTLESYLLTPLIQRKAVSIPPALLISVQVLLGILVGSVGVMLATPLAVSAIILLQMLYLEDVLGENVHVIGHSS